MSFLLDDVINLSLLVDLLQFEQRGRTKADGIGLVCLLELITALLTCLSVCGLCSMEIVWHGKFNELFATFPHLWTLKPIDSPAQQATVFNDSAKVRFLCKVCDSST